MGFTFNGQHSNEFGLAVKNKNRQILPPVKETYIEIPDKHGSLHFPGVLQDRFIEIECAFKGSSWQNVREKAREIGAWLYTTDQAIFSFDDEPDKYYLGKLDIPIDPEQAFVLSTFLLRFRCNPFAYGVNEIVWTGSIASGNLINLTNPGTFSTPAKFKVTNGFAGAAFATFPAMGLGVCPNVSLSTNSNPRFTLNNEKELKYNGILEGEDEFVIDTGKYEAEKNESNVLGMVEGIWFELKPGNNSFRYDDNGGNTADFEIRFRGRWI